MGTLVLDQWFSIFLGPRPKFSSKNLSRPWGFYIYRIKKVVSKIKFIFITDLLLYNNKNNYNYNN